MTKPTERSTKNEIWEAYRQAMRELEQRPVSVAKDSNNLQQMITDLTEAKAALLGNFDSTIERLSNVSLAYTEADQALTRRKATILEAVEQDKRRLDTTIEGVRKQWQQEQADHTLQRQRDEETYQYNLARKRRDEQEVFDNKIKTKEHDLATRELAVSEREQNINQLNKQVEAFPQTMEQAVKAAREEVAKDLKTQSAAELKEAKQTLEHEKSILQLKLQTAEGQITAQSKQIAELQRQLDAAAGQLKDMAVTVIRSQNTPAALASTNTSN